MISSSPGSAVTSPALNDPRGRELHVSSVAPRSVRTSALLQLAQKRAALAGDLSRGSLHRTRSGVRSARLSSGRPFELTQPACILIRLMLLGGIELAVRGRDLLLKLFDARLRLSRLASC